MLRAKYSLLQGEIVDIAGAVLAKLDTGDEKDFLGTGTTTVRPFLIFSRTFFGGFTPHLNIGWEFNLSRDNQSALEYVIGFDVGTEKVTLAAAVLGSHELDGDGIGDDIVTGSLGVRWNPLGQFVLFVNTQIPLNDRGLRSDLITTFGAQHSL